jgi:hypothetical protein
MIRPVILWRMYQLGRTRGGFGRWGALRIALAFERLTRMIGARESV